MKVCIPLADGFEDIEAITIIDVLRRAELDVTTVYLKDNPVTSAHNVKIEADKNIDAIDSKDYDLIALPGGMPGSTNLMEDHRVIELVKQVYNQNGRVAAICAAPMVLGKAGILEGKKATCYPRFEDKMTGANPQDERVVVDGRVITGNGPGSAIYFALKLVEIVKNKQTADSLHQGMLVK